MNGKILMDTTVYTSITDSIGTSAESCVLPDVELLPGELTEGTDITSLLHEDIERLYELMKDHNVHTAEVLPTALLTARDSFIAIDEAGARSIKFRGEMR